MSADLLRRAAAKLRGYAEAAPAGPWESIGGGDRLIARRSGGNFVYVVDEPMSNADAADYIALMHPPVALALADVLESLAGAMKTAGACRDERLEAVARAVLREGGAE